MTQYQYQALYELWHANLEATRRMAALALEAGAAGLRMQIDVAQELTSNGSQPLRASSSTTGEERHVLDPFAACSDIVTRAMEATRIWAEAAVEARAELSRIAGAQSPAGGPSLIGAWLSAARAGQELSAVTEQHQHKIAGGRTSSTA